MKKTNHIFILLLILIMNFSGFSQNQEIKDLKKVLNKEKSFNKKSDILYKISDQYIKIKDNTSALKYAEMGLELAKNKNQPDHIIKFILLVGDIYYESGKFRKSADQYRDALFLSARNDENKYEAFANMGLGKSMWRLGKYKESVYFSTEAINIFEKIEDNYNVANCKGNIGAFYIDIGDLQYAFKMYNEILSVYENLNDTAAIANVYEKMGVIKFYKGYYPYARKYYTLSYDLFKEINKDLEAAIELGNIAETYEMEKNYAKALKFYKNAIKTEEKYQYSSGLIFLYQALGRTYFKTGNKYKAKEYYFKSINIINEINEIRELPKVYKLLYKLFESSKDYKNAFKYAMKESEIKDSISGLIVKKQINEIKIKYETQKKEEENTSLRKKGLYNEAQNQKQKLLLRGLIILLALIIIFALILFKIYRKNKRTAQLLENKNDQLNTVYKNITDSIAYAGNIQKALLSSFKEATKNFTDYFVLYEPAHVLSGDFYWSKRINDTIFIAVADSTGHGIPGALISILGMSLLNEIIDEDYIQTDVILNNLRDKIKKALKQKGELGEHKDGWDMSLISINVNTGEAQYSGAFNSVYYIPAKKSEIGSKKEIIELIADRQPVSVYQIEQPFRKEDFTIQKGDMLYLFTDGFTDQLDVKNNRRYTSKRFKELLLSVSEEKMNKQIEIIKQAFEKWKGDFEQVDDVLIMGLKF